MKKMRSLVQVFEDQGMEISHFMYGNYHKSLLRFVWEKILIKVFMGGLSQFYSLFFNGFCFGRKFSGERGTKTLIYIQA